MKATTLQRERELGLAILSDNSEILSIAREVSDLLHAHGLDAAVVGGVAVVLHGHVRTTLDVDIYAPDLERLSDLLQEHGFEFDPVEKQFVKRGVPVHLVTLEQVKDPPRRFEQIDGIRTVSLADLINMKLRSGTSDILRAQDLADVIGLIRRRRLTGDFAPRIAKPLRSEFRKLARAVIERG